MSPRRVAVAPDGSGGYLVLDASGNARFRILPPTVQDASGKTGTATLTLGAPSPGTGGSQAAILAVDPAFLATATYPVTIDPTITWTLYTAPTTLGYDRYAPLSQLTSVAGDPADPNRGTSAYSYDPARNRLSRGQGPAASYVTTSYQYDRADRLQSATANSVTTSYAVNANGNLTGRSASSLCDTFTYDQANRLTQAVVSDCTTSTTNTYAYNGDGVRVTKTVGAATTRHVYDVAGGLPVVLDDGIRKYVWGPTGLAYNVAIATSTVDVYHRDHLGSIRELTDFVGHISTIYLTDEYGVPSTKQAPSGGTASDQPFWFTGELQDAGPGEPGLVYLRARYYDPGTGRFLSKDLLPIDNRFAYAGNNPTNATDPSGMLCVGVQVGGFVQTRFGDATSYTGSRANAALGASAGVGVAAFFNTAPTVAAFEGPAQVQNLEFGLPFAYPSFSASESGALIAEQLKAIVVALLMLTLLLAAGGAFALYGRARIREGGHMNTAGGWAMILMGAVFSGGALAAVGQFLLRVVTPP